MKKIITFLKEVYMEMKKVTWPNRKETTNYTLIVIFFSIVTVIFLGGFDIIIRELRDFII